MKLTILQPFHDKFSFSTLYKVGQVAEFDEERADRLIRLKLATPTETEEHVEETSENTTNVEQATEAEQTQDAQPIETQADEPTEEVKEKKPRRGKNKE